MSEPKEPTRSERIRALEWWIAGTGATESLIQALALLCEQLEEMAAESRRDVNRVGGLVDQVKREVDQVKHEVRRLSRISAQ